MKMKVVRLLLGVLFLFAASASVLADDTYVYTFTSNYWYADATKNGTATTPKDWKYSIKGYSFSSGYGVRLNKNNPSSVIICSPISYENISEISVAYGTGGSGATIKIETSATQSTTGTVTALNSPTTFSSDGTAKVTFTSANYKTGYVRVYASRSTGYMYVKSVTIKTKSSAAPSTVSFNAHGKAANPASLTESVAGAGVILPDLDVSPLCGRWQFAGWATASISTATTTTPTLLAPGINYKPSENITLHAVYKKDGGLVTTTKTYRFSTTSATLVTDNGTWTGTTPTAYAAATAYSSTYGVGWYASGSSITSPESLANISKIEMQVFSSYWTEFYGTYAVSIGGTSVGSASEGNAIRTINVSPAKNGQVTITMTKNSVLGTDHTLYIGYVTVYYTDYVGFTYHSNPSCPTDISDKVLWASDGFSIEGKASGEVKLPRAKLTSGVLNSTTDVLNFATPLSRGEVLELTVDGTPSCVKVPAIVSGTSTSVVSDAESDIVILPNAKLTLNSGASLNARNLYIYRTNDHSGQLDMKGGTLNLSGKANLVLTIDPKRYYFFGTPAALTLSSARYLNGNASNYNTSSATTDWWIVQNYDGARRASVGMDEKNWQGIQSASTQLKAAEGHAIGIDIVGKADAQRSYVFPFTANLSTENAAKTISLKAHPTSLTQLDEGWNLVCNPYLHTMSGRGASLPTNRILYFVRPYKGTDQRFQQYLASEINDIEPFEVFFVQVRGSSNSTLTLGGNGARPSAPRRAGDLNEEEVFFLRLNLFTPDSDNDNATMVVGSEFSASELVAGEDMEKFGGGNFVSLYLIEQGSKLAFDAINFNDAASGTRLGFKTVAAGEHRISFSEINGNEQGIEHVWLKDEVENKNVDLLSDDYVFTTGKGTFEDRFVVRAEFKNHQGEITAIDATSPDVTIYVVDDVIHADGITNQDIMLFGADGKMLYSGSARGSWSSASLQQGMYVLKVGAKTYKVVL